MSRGPMSCVRYECADRDDEESLEDSLFDWKH